MFVTGFLLMLAVFVVAGNDRARAWVEASSVRKMAGGFVVLIAAALMAASLGWAFVSWAWEALP